MAAEKKGKAAPMERRQAGLRDSAAFRLYGVNKNSPEPEKLVSVASKAITGKGRTGEDARKSSMRLWERFLGGSVAIG